LAADLGIIPRSFLIPTSSSYQVMTSPGQKGLTGLSSSKDQNL